MEYPTIRVRVRVLDLDLTTVLSLIEALPREDSAKLLSAFLQWFTAPRDDRRHGRVSVESGCGNRR